MPDFRGPTVGGGLTVTGVDGVSGAVDPATAALAEGLPGRPLVEPLAQLRAELSDEGLDHVVLAGSAPAAEAITRTFGVRMTVLDSTDPQRVRSTLADRLDRTVVVVADRSGESVETDAHRRAYLQAFLDDGLTALDAGRRFVVVTEPGTPLERTAHEMGARRVVPAGADRALSPVGLVPSALAGADVTTLLDEATEFGATLGADDSPGAALGGALTTAAGTGRDTLVVADDGTGVVLGDWIEELLAETTGKDGRGILPVAVENPAAAVGSDALLVTVGGALRPGAVPGGGGAPDVTVNGPLGAQFVAWEYATVATARALGIDPAAHPDIRESELNTARLLTHGLPHTTPALVDGAIEVYADAAVLGAATDVRGAVDGLLNAIGDHGYVAVMAFLDPVVDADAAGLRAALAARTHRPVTFGWGPRLLRSCGQYHKGGPQNGGFLQLTGAVITDLPVPGTDYTFGTLQAAQAAGDLQALGGRGRPIVRLHLTDRAAGLAQLLEAVR
ncbi:hypothetical protein [Cryptosporangium aurantiacum]|uniref:Glucose-6-phosphate isomerase n=1 Tax=Cryptosporangium aurantiacum TaxID=134849 RepID=A0A1M7J5T7_9ACTN|nr:hypothetical protein [Cryptosporangium aurantiacum]SHM48302.1 glucose-6-phosphate isomerase [Cryptosporangium aurantiacum]